MNVNLGQTMLGYAFLNNNPLITTTNWGPNFIGTLSRLNTPSFQISQHEIALRNLVEVSF